MKTQLSTFRSTLFIWIGLFCFYPIDLQSQDFWNARWLSLSQSDLPDYAVVHARNEFNITSVPGDLTIDLSAVIRYKLYVNGEYLGQGPANNDLEHYSFDTYDIAPFLKEGNNVIGLTVFSLGEMNPVRYHDLGLRFILKSQDDKMGESLNTGTGNWKLWIDKSYEATFRDKDFEVLGYFAMGGGEQIKGEEYPWGWNQIGFAADKWHSPKVLDRGVPYGHTHSYGHAEISLNPREIPMMNEEKESKPIIRKTSGNWEVDNLQKWNSGEKLIFAPNSETIILLDQKYLTKGHTHFTFSGGEGSQVEVAYAETLFYEDNTQGNRNEIEGKKFIGQTDRYLLDGGENKEYSQLLPRTWRYIQVKVKTGAKELHWDNYIAHKFIYPFQEAGYFKTPFTLHDEIWDVGWRTALLCADETYMDCPYYEQLQYIGDTRVQALISLYAAGDDRLMKNALRQFAHSITDEGIAQSRYPSNLRQMIPPYSLFWINMMHDYYMHREDSEFIKSYIPQIASILFWFENKLEDDYILGSMPWWSYTDVAGWEMSSPPGFKEGGSVVMTLQFLYAIQEAIPLFQEFGKDMFADHFSDLSTKIKSNIRENAWDQNRQLFADKTSKETFSQHANIFAILTNTVDKSAQRDLFDRIISEEELAQANIYFRFYLTRAAQQSGNGDYFINNLNTWEDMLAEGLTTFAEHEKETRSDCHAWSASPNFEFIHTVCGIQPAEKYFQKVLISPNPGDLNQFEGKMPHPKGAISVRYDFENRTAQINLPDGLDGEFIWKGKSYSIEPGTQHITW